ncbi:unnamed protein product [Linum tenue]|uniref:Uncharacterized protein n=1 Tax=Linum tenue TaxID=586396 RepID=A0AAV0LYK8_9ROSI|nr:unnamed protein product [Linum tenue]
MRDLAGGRGAAVEARERGFRAGSTRDRVDVPCGLLGSRRLERSLRFQPVDGPAEGLH